MFIFVSTLNLILEIRPSQKSLNPDTYESILNTIYAKVSSLISGPL